MCLPALALVGGIVSGIGAMAGASAQANTANAQAAAYERQAAAERMTAQFNADRQLSKNMGLLSQQRTAYLAAGLSLEGSPTDVIEDTARETQIDVEAIKWNGDIKAQNFEAQRDIFKMKADSAMTAGIFGAISPVIKGFSGTFGVGGGDYYGGRTVLDEA